MGPHRRAKLLLTPRVVFTACTSTAPSIGFALFPSHALCFESTFCFIDISKLVGCSEPFNSPTREHAHLAKSYDEDVRRAHPHPRGIFRPPTAGGLGQYGPVLGRRRCTPVLVGIYNGIRMQVNGPPFYWLILGRKQTLWLLWEGPHHITFFERHA